MKMKTMQEHPKIYQKFSHTKNVQASGEDSTMGVDGCSKTAIK